jgi:2-polyprenyl-6-methoxyphenol hydroxylase-like FAD-dependent oxidoreductase
MAAEDGVILAESLSRSKSQDISHYISTFESIRKDRCYKVQSGLVKNEDFWHMEDGARQRARDAIMRDGVIDHVTLKELRNDGMKQWTDPASQAWLLDTTQWKL